MNLRGPLATSLPPRAGHSTSAPSVMTPPSAALWPSVRGPVAPPAKNLGVELARCGHISLDRELARGDQVEGVGSAGDEPDEVGKADGDGYRRRRGPALAGPGTLVRDLDRPRPGSAATAARPARPARSSTRSSLAQLVADRAAASGR